MFFFKRKNSENYFPPAYIKCMAAETSMRFGPGGRVSVCCHNHSDIAGNIKDKSVMEIWEGESMIKLRKKLSKKFASGCTYCINERASANSSRSASLYDRYPPDKKHPVILDFKADNRCNLQCIMCSGISSSCLSDHPATSTNLYQNPAFLNQLSQNIPYIKEARFSGGEPFLSTLYYKIWDIIFELNPDCNITVQTNGTILTQKVKDYLNKGKFNINVSIDSFNKNNYERIRKGSKFENVQQNIEYFKRYCLDNKRFWGITSCIMIDTIEEVYETIRHWNFHSAFGWFSIVWLPANRAVWSLPSSKIKKYITDLAKFEFESNTAHEKNNINVLSLLINTLKNSIGFSDILFYPEKMVKTEEFIKNLLCRLKSINDYEAIEGKLNCALAEYQGYNFNENVFNKMLNFTSEELLIDLITYSEINRIREIFDPFVIKNHAGNN